MHSESEIHSKRFDNSGFRIAMYLLISGDILHDAGRVATPAVAARLEGQSETRIVRIDAGRFRTGRVVLSSAMLFVKRQNES